MQRQPDAEEMRLAAALREALLRAAVSEALLATEAAPAATEQLLDLIVRTAAKAIPSPEGALFLVDAPRRVLVFEVVTGQTARVDRSLTVPLGHGIAGLVAVSGQPLAVANAQEDPRHARDIAEQIGYFPTTILAVPVMTADGAILGVLELLDRQGAPTYSLDDIALASWFAQLAAVALELRRVFSLRALLTGHALATLGGLPAEVRDRLEPSLAELTSRVEADPVAQQSRQLAEHVVAIARRGEAAQDLCLAILAAFATYLEETPAPGAGLDALR